MLDGNTNVFITGATGLIGGELVRALVPLGVSKVWALVRPTSDASPRERLAERMRRGGDVGIIGRDLKAVAGDMTLSRLGLSDGDHAEITKAVDVIIHCASESSFIRDRDCVRTNIYGVENLIELTRQCSRRVLVVYLGTAANCGAVMNRCLSESDGCAPDNEHHNEYTRSKAVGERRLRESGLPVLVVRPSIVVSASLPDRKFARAVLWFLPLLKEFEAVPIDPESRLDVVPVRFVADSIISLLRRPECRYDCYHLSSGMEGAVTCGEIARFLDQHYERPVPLRLVKPSAWTTESHRRYVNTQQQRKVFSTLRHYLPFANMNVVFDNRRLRDELGELMPEVVPLTSYLPELLSLMSYTEALHESANP